MIDGSEKCNRQLAFQLQNSHVCEKRIRICDRSAQFLGRERRERCRVRINRRASEEDSSG